MFLFRLILFDFMNIFLMDYTGLASPLKASRSLESLNAIFTKYFPSYKFLTSLSFILYSSPSPLSYLLRPPLVCLMAMPSSGVRQLPRFTSYLSNYVIISNPEKIEHHELLSKVGHAQAMLSFTISPFLRYFTLTPISI